MVDVKKDKQDRQNSTYTLQQSTCAYCGVGCGVDVKLQNGLPESLLGTPDHPANYGKLCVKGTHLLDTVGPENRLLHPHIKGEKVSWQHAIDEVSQRFKTIISEHGKEAVAFYVSGQLLTEDYYVANKLMKGYIGTGNIDTNSRLCMSSAVAGYKRAFGEDVVPCDYADLEQTELLILVGSNAAWTHPVLFQRMERAKGLNPQMKVVVIDPRRTATANLADLFLPIKPGTDVALFNGLLHYLSLHDGLNQQAYLDRAFISAHTDGFTEALEAASAWSIQRVADYCVVSVDDVTAFYALFSKSSSAVSFYSMGVNQSASGVDKCNAIINVHLASGKILKPGCGPFSITGQPNAMGGREVGGLANQLASHMDIHNETHRDLVQRFWQSPNIAQKNGDMAVDMFNNIAQGKIKAVWIMATNPVVSMPNRNAVIDALEKCELVVVSDCVANNDTMPFADIQLPATGWLEKNGTVTNSERRISRQRGIVPPLAEARHDWQIICDVAKAMGFEGFDFTHPAGIFNEWCQLTGFENNGQRQLNLFALSGMGESEYDAMRPVQWPLAINLQPTQVFPNNQFSTVSGNAQFVAVEQRLPIQQTDEQFPLVMNSGRIRDQWHTMTRSGLATALNEHISKPFITLNPIDATPLGVVSGDIVQAASAVGHVLAYAEVSSDVTQGACFMPIHWNKQFASSANASNLYQSVFDPISGQPESKHAAVNLKKALFEQYFSLYVSEGVPLQPHVVMDFWVKSQSSNYSRIEGALGIDSKINAGVDELLTCQQVTQVQGEWIKTVSEQQISIVCLQAGRLMVAAFFDVKSINLSAVWVSNLLGSSRLSFTEVQSLLNMSPNEEYEQGRQICSCFKVREKQIMNAIESGITTVSGLGRELKCGTNCGSCKSELNQMLQEYTSGQTAIKSSNAKSSVASTAVEVSL